MLFRKAYIEMDGPLYAFGCGELIRLILQISNHSLSSCKYMVFRQCVSFGELWDGSI